MGRPAAARQRSGAGGARRELDIPCVLHRPVAGKAVTLDRNDPRPPAADWPSLPTLHSGTHSRNRGSLARVETHHSRPPARRVTVSPSATPRLRGGENGVDPSRPLR
jgi:hypothetical protein